uniref:Uncharacterized protein n=1 Tax=Cryptomonas curvata TaxID=233186 RepID=A0A7S0MRA5_9CRYP
MEATAGKKAVTATAAVMAAAVSPMTMVEMTLLVAEVAVTATMVRGVITTEAKPMGAARTVAVVLTLTTVVVAVEAAEGAKTTVETAEAVVTTIVALTMAAV